MDETIIASTSKWRGERKEGEKDATRSKRKKINTILHGGPSKATTAAAVAFTVFFFILSLLLLFYIFLFVTTLIVGATIVSQNNKNIVSMKTKTIGEPAESEKLQLGPSQRTVSERPLFNVPRMIHLAFPYFVRTIFLLLSPPLRAYAFYRPFCARAFNIIIYL